METKENFTSNILHQIICEDVLLDLYTGFI